LQWEQYVKDYEFIHRWTASLSTSDAGAADATADDLSARLGRGLDAALEAGGDDVRLDGVGFRLSTDRRAELRAEAEDAAARDARDRAARRVRAQGGAEPASAVAQTTLSLHPCVLSHDPSSLPLFFFRRRYASAAGPAAGASTLGAVLDIGEWRPTEAPVAAPPGLMMSRMGGAPEAAMAMSGDMMDDGGREVNLSVGAGRQYVSGAVYITWAVCSPGGGAPATAWVSSSTAVARADDDDVGVVSNAAPGGMSAADLESSVADPRMLPE